MNNRRLLFAIIFVLLFAVGVIGWFFFYTAPQKTPSLGQTLDPLSSKKTSNRFQFIFNHDEETPTTTTEVTFAKPEILTEIWNKPATAQTFIENSFVQEVETTTVQGTTTLKGKKLERATTTLLMFVDRTSGYIYAYNRTLGKLYQISNTTIPGIYDAYIFNNGKNIVFRYEDLEKHTIIGTLATIPEVNEKEQAKPLTNIVYLPAQVTSVAVNRNKTLLSYLVVGDEGASIYTVSGKGVILVAKTTFKEWSLSYGNEALFATSKPSAYVSGQTVYLPSFEAILLNKTGLQSNPSEGGIFLHSMWSSSGLKTFLSREGNQVIVNTTTLASKCEWGRKEFLVCAVPNHIPKGTEGLPDDWFQGRISFNDSLVTIDARTAEVTPLYTFNSDKSGIFDVTHIAISEDNSFIAFTKKQSSLWLLDTNLLKNEQ